MEKKTKKKTLQIRAVTKAHGLKIGANKRKEKLGLNKTKKTIQAPIRNTRKNNEFHIK